jgi:hypothetical protein
MKTKLKDVIHFYIGCEVRVPKEINEAEKTFLSGIYTKMINPDEDDCLRFQVCTINDTILWLELDEVKLVLRKLPALTAAEAKNIGFNFPIHESYNPDKFPLLSRQWAYLASRGIDLFGLIETGQALEKQS